MIQYRSRGRSRRYTIGLHGVWTPETARREAKAQLGRVAQGGDPAEEREEDRKALTINQLCEQYISDMEAGPILGKGGRPKKDTTIATDVGRTRRVEADSPTVISAYEKRIARLEEEKIILLEQAITTAAPQRSFEEMFELSMRFLSSPWNIWASERIELRRLVLRLAFAERLGYVRNQGFRTSQFSSLSRP